MIWTQDLKECKIYFEKDQKTQESKMEKLRGVGSSLSFNQEGNNRGQTKEEDSMIPANCQKPEFEKTVKDRLFRCDPGLKRGRAEDSGEGQANSSRETKIAERT